MILWHIFTLPDVSITVYVAFDEAYQTHAGLSIAITNRFDAQRYLKYWAKLYHNYKSDSKRSYKIYMISEVTKYESDPKSHCSMRGLNSYAMSFHPLSIASIPRQKMWKKINMHSNIGLSSLTFVFMPLPESTSELRGPTEGTGGVRGHWGITYEKWRQSIARYSWKLQTVYCR